MDDLFSNDEYVTSVIIDISRRSFYLVSNEGIIQEIGCETIDQFETVLEIVQCSQEIDPEIELVYADPMVSESAGVV
tara:strand:+ start:580 stop:810 length:231 start_codon:yes stop_codon:yes gene_type:complete